MKSTKITTPIIPITRTNIKRFDVGAKGFKSGVEHKVIQPFKTGGTRVANALTGKAKTSPGTKRFV